MALTFQQMTKILEGLVNGLLPLICGVLEIIAIDDILSQHDSICIQAREISSEARVFLLLVCTVVIPDLVFSATVLLDVRGSARPFGVLYHGYAAVICLYAALYLTSRITFCGNSAQDTFYSSAILIKVAATLHLLNVLIILWLILLADKNYATLLSILNKE